jgi:hypothetical protein
MVLMGALQYTFVDCLGSTFAVLNVCLKSEGFVRGFNVTHVDQTISLQMFITFFLIINNQIIKVDEAKSCREAIAANET